jgi:phosphate starvation-inducible protein PhoH
MGRKNSNANRGNNRQRNYKPWQDATEEDRVQTAKPVFTVVRAITDSLKRYDAAIKSGEVIFGDGPAGTGKTLMAVARAAEALDNGVIDKIIVTRPAVTVEGEEFGFLPGRGEIRAISQASFRSFHTSCRQGKVRLLGQVRKG